MYFIKKLSVHGFLPFYANWRFYLKNASILSQNLSKPTQVTLHGFDYKSISFWNSQRKSNQPSSKQRYKIEFTRKYHEPPKAPIINLKSQKKNFNKNTQKAKTHPIPKKRQNKSQISYVSVKMFCFHSLKNKNLTL